MAWPVRRYFRLLWLTLCFLTLMALPLLVWEFQRIHYDVHRQAWFIGGIFAILSVPISIYEIALHTEYYTQPHLQKHVIRILLMVPIYAVDAWLALRFAKAREYLDPIRECYEAFVVYSFLAYLMAFLQEKYPNLEGHMREKPQVQHLCIARWLLRPWDMGTRYLWECKKGVLNFVIIRPVCTALAFITDIFGKYDRGQIDFKKSYVYLAAVTNFSQLWALYCLVMLYTAMHTELAPIRPLSKFLCIKAVIFVTFWQSIAIAILVYAGVIRQDSWYDTRNVASGLQDFLICIEMFLAALAHAYAFPPRDYMGAGYSAGFFANVPHIFNLRDVVDDVGRVMEEHVTSAASAVVEAPKRAVKKAARGLASTRKLFTAAGKGSPGGRLTDDEEQVAGGAVPLRPTSFTSGSGAGGESGSGSSSPDGISPATAAAVAAIVTAWPAGGGGSGGGRSASSSAAAGAASAPVASGEDLKEPLLSPRSADEV
ncbi:hypothetical protein Vretimale_11220 [Volvox reticuliferus]|uniref:Uncharacterized protein n=1 Tax=Volvox reticuliferus TaxID=1737510 RepID=A0A8J4CIZ7_9CHLO|nr:hypothetical protein Vretifemale_12234 [Volvox reticuliferus]GIM07017.1 hypothetical protein Vretimale_11220 [Volvox reticuliferus]